MKKLFVVIAIVFIFGCSHYSSSIRLSQLSKMNYQEMHDRLTTRSDYDTGLFLEVRAFATLLVPEMKQYRSDIPDDGTAVERMAQGINSLCTESVQVLRVLKI
jgi:hypothetical protein